MRGAEHVEEKHIAALAGPIARLAHWLPTKCPSACPQHTLFFERSAMSLRTRKLGPRSGPSRGSLETGFAEASTTRARDQSRTCRKARLYGNYGITSGLPVNRQPGCNAGGTHARLYRFVGAPRIGKVSEQFTQ